MNWHKLTIEETLAETRSQQDGLDAAEVEKRLKEFGYNTLEEKKKKPAWMLFLNQFKDFMILVLIAAAIISGFIGDKADTIIILVIVLLNAVVGFVQEYRAEKAMEALKKMANPQTNVMRGGKVKTIDSSGLVPGDIVLMEAGNTIPADLRLNDVKGLKVMEASLTGESVAIDKTKAVIDEDDPPLGDRSNMAFRGTEVTNGHATGIVVATGMETELGKIAKMLQEKEEMTPLQKRMLDFGKKLSYLILVVCAVLFGVGLLRGEEPLMMLLISISLAVAAIPEALPALITITLSNGAKRLVKQQALIRKLAAVETLGSVSYICTDKTGTLTQNKMTVVKAEPAETEFKPHNDLDVLRFAMGLNHTVNREGDKFIGDPTEVAMVEHVAGKHSEELFNQLPKDFSLVKELPFDSERKGMTTVHKYNDGYIALAKGAVEFIVERMSVQDGADGIQQRAEEMAAEGIRVIGFGYRKLDNDPDGMKDDELEQELEFAGLAGLIDPPREEIKAAISECKTAGIKPVMITGDHPETAAAIARQIGLLSGDELVVTGRQLERMSKEEFADKVEGISVYARVSPAQKLDIVKALQQKSHFIAMTGDGVNDAPSLKKANIGIAMGITGTDVSKEAAHMILLDDNFATIVKAVKEGRRIYDNIRKFVKYIMACNSAEILTIFIAPLIGLPIPLLPVHILWINLVTDGLPGLALSIEGAEADVMKRPPRKPKESLFAGGNGIHIIWVGVLMAGVTLLTQAWYVQVENSHWQTMVFTVLSLSQLAHVYAIRSDTQSIYRKGLFSNMLLVYALLLTFALQLAVIYLPFANGLFKTQPLTLIELGVCLLVAAFVFHAVEFEKWIKRRALSRRVE